MRGSGSEAPAAARNPRSSSTTGDPGGPAAQLPATSAGGASAGRSGVPNVTARRISWSASLASEYGLVRAKRSCDAREDERRRRVARPSRRGTPRLRPGRRARRPRTRRSRARRSGCPPFRTALPTRTPPARPPRARGCASPPRPPPPAATRDAARAPARRTRGRTSSARTSSVSRGCFSGSSTSTARSFTKPSGTTSDAAGIFTPTSARRRWSAPRKRGPRDGESPGPS